MITDDLLDIQTASLRKKIVQYRKVARKIEEYLTAHPFDWGRFQSDFNIEVNGIFRDIMNFEKQCLAKGDESSVYKLKRLFVNHLRRYFHHGEYILHSVVKPFGYAGDFKIIDDIYQNSPKTSGFDRLYDNFFQSCTISVAVRNRKEDFKKFIISFVEKHPNQPIRIMDLASGPCRDLKELLSLDLIREREVVFDCYEQDDHAIHYAEELIGNQSKVNFIKENAVRLALKKDIEPLIKVKYDLIYSTGLFDYLDKRVSVRLVANLRKLIKIGGMMIVSDVRDKYKNPSVHFMEWGGEWNLVYRSDDEFKQIFLDAGFQEADLDYGSEQQGVMQYIIATRNK
ncbi:MAG TPA: class I SAM-dependent methyltransferase [Candidatus Omnitrophota bacterium]|nr:class I SAM-dependent methyltransferase [Candidatus Omnitrophota bacterium]